MADQREMNSSTSKPGQGPQDLTDDVRQAAESGEPELTGRSHGHVINDMGAPAGSPDNAPAGKSNPAQHNDNTGGKSGKISQATESGRQRAI